MEKQEPKNKVITWLFNPFHYLAGGTALGFGFLIIIVSGLIAYLTNSHFDGVLDFHSGMKTPIWFNLSEVLFDWIILGLCLLILGRCISKTRFRFIDVFGTQALARFPTLFMALITLLPGYQSLLDKLMVATPMNAVAIITENIGGLMILTAIGLVVLVMVIWMVVLMYRAFAISCNVTGKKAIIGFIITLIIAEILSKVVIIAIVHSAQYFKL